MIEDFARPAGEDRLGRGSVAVDAVVDDVRRPPAGVVCAEAVELEAGVLEAGVLEAGVLEAGVLEAGVLEAGVLEAGVLEAGVLEAGVLEAGVLVAAEAQGPRSARRPRRAPARAWHRVSA